MEQLIESRQEEGEEGREEIRKGEKEGRGKTR